ncbi:MAG: hypothetical protein CVU13_07810 [Bacteroidetes bacterium HGW-Bacteroidetes-8]|jgi:thiol-disulfide isomerase/thioredoxin|nr:MAG: hypothetical protein CVU13_07810 [Bacteroidetes bacterium HGW-Bacteroidetes-8]
MKMEKNIFKGIVMLITVIFSFITIKAPSQPTSPTLKIGDKAPGLMVTKWVKGNPVSGFEAGKVYVVEFWATWCQPCIAGMPHLSDLADKYRKDISVIGVSIMERGDDILSRVENFVQKSGDKMRYLVAADSANYMRDNWLYGAGERGIPYSFIVDKNGEIAWCGYPKSLDRVLPLIIEGKWDNKKAELDRKEGKRLSIIDGNDIVAKLNPFMGNPGNPIGALAEIEKILLENPGLKYYPKLGHFTFWSLIKTDPDMAVEFAKEWFAINDFPSWKTVTDAVMNMVGRNVKLPKAVYELAAESFQAQIDNYPGSMNIPVTFNEIARLEYLAGNKEKAITAQVRAIEEAKRNVSFSPSELVKFEENLSNYKK